MMTAMINTLKKINRTVLEMTLGILFLGVLAQIIGAFIVKDKMMYAGSLWCPVGACSNISYVPFPGPGAGSAGEDCTEDDLPRIYPALCDTDFYITGAYEDRGDESADLLFLLCDMYESNGVSTAINYAINCFMKRIRFPRRYLRRLPETKMSRRIRQELKRTEK